MAATGLGWTLALIDPNDQSFYTYGPNPGDSGSGPAQFDHQKWNAYVNQVRQLVGEEGWNAAVQAGYISPNGIKQERALPPLAPDYGNLPGGKAWMPAPQGSKPDYVDPNYGPLVIADTNRAFNPEGLYMFLAATASMGAAAAFAPAIGAAAPTVAESAAAGAFGPGAASEMAHLGSVTGAGSGAFTGGGAAAAGAGASAADPFLNAGAGSEGGAWGTGAGSGAGAGTSTAAGTAAGAGGAANVATTAGGGVSAAARWAATALGISPEMAQTLIEGGTALGGLLLNQYNTNQTTDAVGNLIPQQTEANLATAREQNRLNNPNINTPLGSSTWTIGPDGRPINTQTLSPAEQAKLEKGNTLALGGLDIANTLQGQLGESLGQPFGLEGAPETVNPADWGSVQRGLDFSGAGPIQKDPGAFAPLQMGLNFSGAPPMPGADASVRDKVSKAFFDQQYNLLSPYLKQQQSDLDTMLANQGIARDPQANLGSGAWEREQENLADQRLRMLGDLANRSVISGGDAMQQLFSMALGARQQGVGEATTQGQFANTAQNQQVQQLLAAMAARNAAQQQGATQIQQAGDFWNRAQNQVAGQALQAQAGNNAARGQRYQEYTSNRTMPLQLYNAFLNGGQVNMPQFPGPASTNIQPTNTVVPGLAGINARNTGTGNALNILDRFARPYMQPGG